MSWVAGVDGCRAGWVAVYLDLEEQASPVLEIEKSFIRILDGSRRPAIIAVDMPIGLPDRSGPGGRAAEREVRPILGIRRSSVFSVPSRRAVMATSYREACEIAFSTSEPPRKVSQQCFNIFEKIREVDGLMNPLLESRVYEVHPEVAFWRLNDRRPMRFPKKRFPEGRVERQELLSRHGFVSPFLYERPPTDVGFDDVLDAAVSALIAVRIARKEAESFPSEPPRDESKGLRMAIWA